MSEKLNLARLKKFGKKFEISIEPHAAVAFKKGELTNIHEVLNAEHIYVDARKGQLASETELLEVFETTDTLEVAAQIIKDGELQLTADQRSEGREERWKQLIDFIHKQAADPKTGLPHPPTRIDAALKEAKIHLDEHKAISQQIDEILSKLRPIIPITIEKKKITFTLPGDIMGKCYSYIKNNSNILKENWDSNGKWQATIELPAGIYPEFVEKLQGIAHGALEIKND